jgi:ubiquinol-cytochrome c reductase cytochrome c subunit
MPMTDTDGQPRRKPPAYEPAERDALVEHVGTLGDGIDLDDVVVDVDDGDVAAGGTIYRANCAPCHAAAGIGGALNEGRLAPSVDEADPLVVMAAVRVGPGQMPVFPPDALDDQALADVVAYTQHLRDPPARGGASLGGAGPIPEGAVAWLFGFGVMAAATWWIGSRERAV